MCSHKLSVFKALVASGPFKHICAECGQLVYREHPRATLPFHVLFIDRIGIVFIAVVFLLFPYLLAATLLFAILILSLYIWDIAAEPLKVFSGEERDKERNKNKKILISILVIVIVSILVKTSM